MQLEPWKLGTTLDIVQTEGKGTRHYKDVLGNRLILFVDGSYTIEKAEKPK